MATAETSSCPESTALKKSSRRSGVADRHQSSTVSVASAVQQKRAGSGLSSVAEHAVDGNVQVALLKFAGNGPMVGIAAVGVRKVDQIDVPDARCRLLRHARLWSLRPGRGDREAAAGRPLEPRGADYQRAIRRQNKMTFPNTSCDDAHRKHFPTTGIGAAEIAQYQYCPLAAVASTLG